MFDVGSNFAFILRSPNVRTRLHARDLRRTWDFTRLADAHEMILSDEEDEDFVCSLCQRRFEGIYHDDHDYIFSSNVTNVLCNQNTTTYTTHPKATSAYNILSQVELGITSCSSRIVCYWHNWLSSTKFVHILSRNRKKTIDCSENYLSLTHIHTHTRTHTLALHFRFASLSAV